mmetsp:Transcript_31176/g.37070  ORF Transcript_31176/g.37070 Transcript_31176/m.37070 type:complete len:284 (+) Transcript_31176:109-960(+)|eukprot:CAMPEP_0198262050 /NCGR_PEP_ID=MMETSP1447-20131203/10609_1 /TAXON_ID=420782 /ORGANISM="Chaetoceros dichaeta, Strain CCMP1751" /LENGTH=283 /DNA_ID=CAMNT_0043950137 /DNA_START=123 /DNA_END=974 /DNA_ORIENTATION=+
MATEDSEKIQGNVKWFSNQKGYGFITPIPGSSTTEDIFVHQSVITSEGYRTLGEGWVVEFEIGHDDDGKIKAENVTGLGGGPCTGPRHPRRRNGRRQSDEENPDEESGAPDSNNDGEAAPPRRNRTRGQERAGGRPSQPKTIWHDGLEDGVKDALKVKEIRTSTGTIDIALGAARIKLGTRGYSSMADAEGLLVEGSFDCDAAGNVTFDWKKAIQFETGEGWLPRVDLIGLINQISLLDDDIAAVGLEEDMASLMGDHPDDPKPALELNGFEMRRVVLTAKRR